MKVVQGIPHFCARCFELNVRVHRVFSDDFLQTLGARYGIKRDASVIGGVGRDASAASPNAIHDPVRLPCHHANFSNDLCSSDQPAPQRDGQSSGSRIELALPNRLRGLGRCDRARESAPAAMTPPSARSPLESSTAIKSRLDRQDLSYEGRDDMQIHRDGVGLGYEDAGQGEPPILLVHGWGTDRAVLRPLFDWARGARRVLAVDLRGFGESDAPEQAYTIRGYSDDLAFIASQLGLRQPIVVGHSMGGLIALDFAARHAAQISAAVVLEPMAIAPELLAGLRRILAGVRTDEYRDVVARLMGYLTGPHFDPGERARLVSSIRACRQHVLISAMEGILAFDSEAAAANVRCPLLYVGTAVTYANLARFRELCPQLVTGQLVGCGHYFPLEVPEQLTAMVARFIHTNVNWNASKLSDS